MKNRKSISILIAAAMTVIAMIVLAGCSGSAGGGTAFSQTLTSEEPIIWYECQNKLEQSEDETTYIIEGTEEESVKPFGRETKVIWIKVYKDGKLSSYSCLESTNLGYFSKMTDEEIIKELDTEKTKYLCGQKDQPYQIYLYSDAAGQEVVFEGVPSLIQQASKDDPMYFMTLVSKDAVPTFQVYDSYYGGYAIYNYDESMLREACLVTRCEKGASFGLDGMDLEGAVLDYKTPEEMLHEKNAEISKDSKKSSKNSDAEDAEDGEDGEEGEEDEDAEDDEYADDESY